MLNGNISLLSQSNTKYTNKILIPHNLFPGSHMAFFTDLIEFTVNRKKGLYLVKLWGKIIIIKKCFTQNLFKIL